MKKIITTLLFIPILFHLNGQITSTQVVANAESYLNHNWTCTSANIWDNVTCSGTKVVNTPFWVTPGSHTALPYCWGGNSTLSDFDSYLTQNRSAGDDVTTVGAEPSCSVGVDCSGFVSRCYGLSSHYSTSMIGSGNYSIFGFHASSSDVVVGDMWNKPGSHVRLVTEVNPNGSYSVIESGSGTGNVGSPGLWRVFSWSYTLTELSGNGYNPQYYTNMNATLDCSNAVNLTCGVSYTGPSSTAPSNISSFGCNSWTETGPERVHTITPSNSGVLTATLSNYTGDLDVYILGSCDPNDCLGTVSSSSATFNNAVAGETYYIVVDADDGSGSGYDLLVDCAQPLLDCANAVELTCGVTYTAGSSTAPSLVTYFGCNTWTETGPERVHKITPTTNGTITASISNFSGDMDVYILGSCDPDDCLGTVTSSDATYSNAVAGETYYIVVDSDSGSGSGFDLVVTCPAASEDIFLSNVSASATEVNVGGTLDVQADQNYNGSNTNVPDVYLHFYLSTDCSLDASDVMLSDQNFSTINSNMLFQTEMESLIIPYGTTAGSYQILVVTDGTDAITETDETNNIVCLPITVIEQATLTLTEYTETCNGNNTHDPTDDTYDIFINVDAVNGGASNQFTVNLAGNVIATFDYGTGGVIILPASGTSEVLEIKDFDNPFNSLTQWTNPLNVCSPTCSDGLMNGDETGADCGGATCTECICPMTSNVSVNVGNDPNRVVISWDPEPGAIKYQVRTRRTLTTTWTNVITTINSKTVTGLTQNKLYDYRVRTMCADGTWSDMTVIDKFRTKQCLAPTSLTSSQFGINKVKVEWTHYNYADKYQIWYRLADSNDAWLSMVTYDVGMNFRVVNNLVPGATYEWKVRSWCEVSYGPFSELSTFTNAVAREMEMDVEDNFIIQSLSPNPAIDHILVDFVSDSRSNVNLSIVDMMGRTIHTESNQYAKGINQIRLDISNLQVGMYTLVLDNGKKALSKKFVITN